AGAGAGAAGDDAAVARQPGPRGQPRARAAQRRGRALAGDHLAAQPGGSRRRRQRRRIVRFRAVHKLMSYLLAASAVTTLVSSGAVPLPTLGLLLAVGAGSWF